MASAPAVAPLAMRTPTSSAMNHWTGSRPRKGIVGRLDDRLASRLGRVRRAPDGDPAAAVADIAEVDVELSGVLRRDALVGRRLVEALADVVVCVALRGHVAALAQVAARVRGRHAEERAGRADDVLF